MLSPVLDGCPGLGAAFPWVAEPPEDPSQIPGLPQAGTTSILACSSQGWAQLEQLREVQKLSQELPDTSHPSLFHRAGSAQLLRSSGAE